MSNHFNELLLQTLKEINVRLDRLESRVDHVINEKSDKMNVMGVRSEVTACCEGVNAHRQQLARAGRDINMGIFLMVVKILLMGVLLVSIS